MILSSQTTTPSSSTSVPESAIIRDKRHNVEYAIRQHRGDVDSGIVYAPWCNQIRKQRPFAAMTAPEFKWYKQNVIEPLVERCGILVACRINDPAKVYGWICGEFQDDVPVLHFVYVRGGVGFRRHGIGTRLMRVRFPMTLGKREILYTHPTKAVKYFEDRWQLKYDPRRVR